MQATSTLTTPNTTIPATKRTRNSMNRKQNKNKRSKAASNKRATQTAASIDDKDDDICLICCEPIKTYAVGSCNHRNLCAVCCLRRRTLYNQSDCCLCKQQLDQVVFTFDRSSSFSSFNLGLLAILPNAPGVLFDDATIRQDIAKLFSLRCQICEDQSFTSIFALREHLKKHQLHYCSLCLSHKKVFFNEQILYTRGDLKAHLTGKKGGVGPQNGEKEAEHQFCHFCKKRFFDKDHLYNHLMEKHEKCHLCEKDGSPNQYFDDYNALERHFAKDHFLCQDAACLEKKFVVFTTALALQAHDIAAHVATRKMSKSEKREASKLDIGLVFSTSTSSSSAPAPRPVEPPNPPTSTAAHRNTNDPLVNFAEHQQMSESWNFPSLPGSGSEERSSSKPRPVVLGVNQWHKNESPTKSSSRDNWPTLPPAVKATPRRVSPPSPPPEAPGYGGRYGYGGREYRNRRPQAATCWGK